MHNLNVPKINVILTLLKTCCCNKNIDNLVVTYKRTVTMTKMKCVTHVIETYHKKAYLTVVKVMLLKGT